MTTPQEPESEETAVPTTIETIPKAWYQPKGEQYDEQATCLHCGDRIRRHVRADGTSGRWRHRNLGSTVACFATTEATPS